MKPETQERLELIQRRKDELAEKATNVDRRRPSRRPVEESQESTHEILMLVLEEQNILLQEVLETMKEAADRASTAMEKLYEELHSWLNYTTRKG